MRPGCYVQETWRFVLRSQHDLLSAIALLAQAVGSTDPVLRQIYIGISACQSAMEQLGRQLKTHANMNVSIAQDLKANPLCSHLVSHSVLFFHLCTSFTCADVHEHASTAARLSGTTQAPDERSTGRGD